MKKIFIYILLLLSLSNLSGFDVVLYKPDNSIEEIEYSKYIASDSEGVIWIGTDYGLIKYSNAFNKVNFSNSELKSDNVRALAIDRNNDLWLSLEKVNLFAKFNGVSFQYFNIISEVPSHDNINSIIVNSRNHIWLKTLYYLTYYNGKNYKTIEPGHPIFPSIGQPLSMSLDNKDNLWFTTTNDSVFKFNNEGLSTLDIDYNNLSDEISFKNIFIDSDDNIWLTNGVYSTENNELIYFDLETSEQIKYDKSNSPINEAIVEIKQDVNDHIWILTSKKLLRFDGINWETINIDKYIPGLPNDSPLEDFAFRDFVFGNNNEIWLTCYGVGVLVLSDIISSIENEEEIENDITLFPNPTESYIQIENTEQIHISNYDIIDLTGKTVQKDIYSSNQIDISNLSNGVYFIKLYHNNTFIQKKFVIK